MSGGGSGGGGSNTTTQVQQIPEFEQESSRQNQALAQSLGSQPYPQYQGALIQPLNATQQYGQQLAQQAGTNYMPWLATSSNLLQNGVNADQFNGELSASDRTVGSSLNPAQFNAYQGMASNQIGSSLNPAQFNAYQQQAQGGIAQGMNGAAVGNAQQAQAGATQRAQSLTNPNAVGSYMNPFIQQALAPQLSALNLQLAGQQNQINSQAAQAGAFGDARQGAAQGLQNYYGNQAFNQLVGTGYNNAYTQALSALGQAQNTQLGAAGQYGNIAQTGLGEQNAQLAGAQQLQGLAGQQQQEQQIGLQGAQQYGALAGQQQTEQQIGLQGAGQYAQNAGLSNQQQNTQLAGAAQAAAMGNQVQQQAITGANAVYNSGQQQQTNQQQQLNAAYQQYLNQVNWPYQMLNVQESALSNSPYNIATAVTLPSANSTAQGFGTLAGAAGLLGGIAGSGGNNAPFGGQPMQ